MKSLRIKILVGFLLFTKFSSGQAPLVWTAIDPLTDITDMKDVFFLDDNRGWILGWGTNLSSVAKTIDGGVTWTQVYPGGYYFDEIFFTTALIGYGVGDCWAGVYCARTFDGGVTWDLGTTLPGVTSFMWHVDFYSENVGWIGGENESYRTTDGGNTWLPMSLAYVTDTYFITPLIGWAASSGELHKTIDGGVTWSLMPAAPLGCNTVNAFDLYSLVIGCGDGSIYTSDNGGNTWNSVASGVNPIADIQFEGALGVAVGAAGYTKVTYDYGQTWNDNVFTTNSMANVFVKPDGSVFIAASDTNIYRSGMVNDLMIDAYIELDTLCAGVPSDVSVTIKNSGPSAIHSATIVLNDGSTSLLVYDWTGSLSMGQTETISLGVIVLDNSGYFTYTISGDSLTTNNVSTKFIFVDTTVHAGPDQITCAGEEISITASGGNEYYWLGMVGDTTLQTQLITTNVAQQYLVFIKNNHCIKLDSVLVDIEICSDIVTAISPNGDGVNDFLELSNIPTGDNFLKVYNRWGDLVNSFTNYDNDNVRWEGTASTGNSLTEGTYYYVFQSSDNSVNYSSWVQIVR